MVTLDSEEFSSACTNLLPHETVSAIAEGKTGSNTKFYRDQQRAANIINILTNDRLPGQDVALVRSPKGFLRYPTG